MSARPAPLVIRYEFVIRVECKEHTYQASFRDPLSKRILRASCTAGAQQAAEALLSKHWSQTAKVARVEQQVPGHWELSFWRVIE
ncbi:hypothetical protein FACS1894185_3380 [Betaproteobacteria bacterium]|nr:hypothetical protein FACS1894185_3380 [Betaproteobacteria bacterium]